MKIGIITTHMADNYGAVLQAYALSTYVGKQTECDIINYCPPYTKVNYRLKSKIRDPKSALYYIFDSLHLQEKKRRRGKFNSFRNSYMKLSSKCISTEELKVLSLSYDAVITGSDQVWNPLLHSFDENYFLTFCPDSVRKYGYAPSFGVSELKENQKKIVKVRCEGFADISFRENSGARIAKELFGKDFPLVLDPIFLLSREEWLNLMPNVAPAKPYYLCYYLSDPQNSVKHVCKIGKQDGVEVFSIGYSIKDPLNSAKKIYDLGPLEFLAYIYNAECVFTDSFHATAFSILFNRPFFTRIDGKNAERSDRVITLMESVGLGTRAYGESNLSELYVTPVLYQMSNAILHDMISSSQDYIKHIIHDVETEKKIEYTILKDIRAYSGYILDNQLLQKSSSGGFGAAMAQSIIQEGGIVYSVTYIDDFRGAEYRRVDNNQDLTLFVGSKYVKSRGVTKQIVQNVVNDLSEDRRVLFIGLPCEIAALLAGLERNKMVALDNLITVDLICHGPTYPKVQEEYIDELEKKFGGKTTRFLVRYKKPNWIPYYVYAQFSNGKKYVREFIYTNFGEAFSKMPQKGCLSCSYKGTGHVADITIGDYWGIQKNDPSYNKSGVSVALVRTENGERFLHSLSGIVLYPADARYVIEHNLNYAFCAEKSPQYDAFYTDFKEYGLHYTCKKYCSRKQKILMKTPQWILDILKKMRKIR